MVYSGWGCNKMNSFELELISVLKDISKTNKKLLKCNERIANFCDSIYTTAGGRIGLVDLSTYRIEKIISKSLKKEPTMVQAKSDR